jgi:hypothetical protein
VADERSKENCELRQENQRLRAEIEKATALLVTAIEQF